MTSQHHPIAQPNNALSVEESNSIYLPQLAAFPTNEDIEV